MSGIRLSDLAARVGFDISTVSRALRNDPRVRSDTRERVMREAEAMGYHPNLTARALAEGRSRTVWFILPGLERPIERRPASIASRWFLERGYDLLIVQHHGDPVVYARVLERLANGGADGAILIPHSPPEGLAEGVLVEAGIPFVYLDRYAPGIGAPVVTTDNVMAAAALFDALAAAAEKSGKPVAAAVDAFFPERNPVEAARSKGWREAAARHGIPVVGKNGSPVGISSGSPTVPPAGPIALAGSNARWLERARLSFDALAGRKELLAAVFDDWRGPRTAYETILVAVQDFRTMAVSASELLLNGLENGAGAPEKPILVPISGLCGPDDVARPDEL
jgi:DNA-binding LacI/PurR family transcriptional regulator